MIATLLHGGVALLLMAVADDPAYGGIRGEAAGADVVVEAAREETRGGSVYVPAVTDDPPDRYFSATPALCALVNNLDGPTTRYDFACTEGEQLAYEGIECGPDEFAEGAVFREVRQPDGSWGPPELVGDEGCVTPADLLAEAEREFATLSIAPSPVVVQPPDGWTLVNVPTITYTDSAEQTFDATLLGIPVQIRATPESYAWDYADGSAPLVTSDPGAPYPDHTVHHTYEQPVESLTIGLTTSWSGQFRIAGSPTWTDVPGTAATTSAAEPLQVYEARSRLVTDPLG
ncbi:hypothetical protein V5D56_01870 [Cellulosimicrobium sp. PMB13]|uniref:hypothetical protein n=1 Tax=Cellulosimicrobium sp. PMB13 TaxID=3120158 RepID=UPI003F4C1BE9